MGFNIYTNLFLYFEKLEKMTLRDFRNLVPIPQGSLRIYRVINDVEYGMYKRNLKCELHYSLSHDMSYENIYL